MTARAAARTALQAAVLLQAGVPATRIWRSLADGGDGDAERIADRVDAGAAVADALAADGGAWQDIAAAWHVAGAVGAPLADSLRGIVGVLHAAQDADDDVRVALAEPAATARLMAWLPLVGIVLGAALGFDTLRVLTTTPAGLGCLAGGVALLVGARLWTRALVRAAGMLPSAPGLETELMAVALSGGASVERARSLLDDLDLCPDADAERVLALSRAAGVPAVELLRATAAEARRDVRTEARTRAARLGTRLLLPLGVCTLPSFLLLGVAPLLLSVLASTELSL